MARFLLGIVIGLLVLPVLAFAYFRFGNPPVAVADPTLPLEQQIVHVPLDARIDKDAPKNAPLEPNESNMEAGARIYREQCAACHGLYGRPSSFGNKMYPRAPQLWEPHGHGVVGVSDDPPGETFWKIDNGIRLTGMPSFRNVLNQTQEWQVAVLLASADKPLPGTTLDLLKQPLYADAQTPVVASAPAAETK